MQPRSVNVLTMIRARTRVVQLPVISPRQEMRKTGNQPEATTQNCRRSFGGFLEVRPLASTFAKRFCLIATMLVWGAFALAGSGCSAKREPENWVLWYVPN